ncbi:MAG TPA: hypothetical protein VFA45_19235 [Actinomycetes bacterium]|nr:hypothetical protein [Actinomycetes bacterium]
MRATLDRNPTTPAGFGRERAGWTFGRVVSVLTGGVLALCSLGLIAVGGYLLSAATSNGGWLALGHGTYQSDSYAVATDPQDWGTATYALGTVDKVRIRVTPSDPATPVFVGMARPADLERYLRGVQHVTAHGAPGYRVTYTQHPGQAPATPPAHAVPWTVQATGTGTQTLTFDAQQQRGDQVAVVMNADGSRSLSGRAESTITQPSLPWIAGGLLAGGVAVGVGAALLIVKPVRRVRGRR